MLIKKIYLQRNLMKKLYFLIFCFIFLLSKNLYSNQPTTIDSRIKTYIYNPNEVFPVVLHVGYLTHIDFPKNEMVMSIEVGNPVDWEIKNKGHQIFLKNYSKSARTNMMVKTTKRTYEFELIGRSHSAENDYELAYAIKFFYPDNNNGGLKFNYDKNLNYSGISDIIRGKINRNYVFYGKSELLPITVFNDARFTYLKFSSSKIPKIRLYDKNNKKLNANIFLYNNYMIIDKVVMKVKLVWGNECLILVNKNLYC